VIRAVKITLRTLRRDLPRWTWTAHRAGLGGWRYVGALERSVEVFAVALLVGEDDFATSWRVSDGGRTEPYEVWLASERSPMRY